MEEKYTKELEDMEKINTMTQEVIKRQLSQMSELLSLKAQQIKRYVDGLEKGEMRYLDAVGWSLEVVNGIPQNLRVSTLLGLLVLLENGEVLLERDRIYLAEKSSGDE